jgi:hypothetical protein
MGGRSVTWIREDQHRVSWWALVIVAGCKTCGTFLKHLAAGGLCSVELAGQLASRPYEYKLCANLPTTRLSMSRCAVHRNMEGSFNGSSYPRNWPWRVVRC